MENRINDWKKIAIVYILQLFSYATCVVQVNLVAPHYVKYRGTATLFCNHSVSEEHLDKIEFMKGDRKILQYIKGRKPPFVEGTIEGAIMEYSENGTTIKLKDVRFDASGSYSCAVSTDTPIYTKPSEEVQMEVIVPQTENPKITFKKSAYVIGESLEANCSSSAARPVPHLTWYINGKEVDVTLVNHYPITRHEDYLMSATAKLTIEVSELHAGENGSLEISCQSTIPAYPMRPRGYADVKERTVPVRIILAAVTPSSASDLVERLVLIALLGALAMREVIP